jgi:hypothetical protein
MINKITISGEIGSAEGQVDTPELKELSHE